MAGMGAVQQERRSEMIAAMKRFEWDMQDAVARAGRLPAEWQKIWEGRGAPKERVTLRLDRDVVRFFRSMGDGYGPRMNAILRSFMLARLAGMIRHEDLAEQYRETWMGKPRPTPAAEAHALKTAMRDINRAQELLAKAAAGDGKTPALTPEEYAEMKLLAERMSAAG